MRLSLFSLGNPRRIITNAVLTAMISVPTASCLKTESKQSFGSAGNGNAAQGKGDIAGSEAPSSSDPKPDDQKPPTKKAAVSVTWDGNAPRGTPKYAVVATE